MKTVVLRFSSLLLVSCIVEGTKDKEVDKYGE